MVRSRKNIIVIITAVLLEFCVVYGIIIFRQNILMSFPLAVRAILQIAIQWTLLIVPIVLMKKNGEKLEDVGFTKDNIGAQILTGLLVSLVISAIFTVFPILIGLKDMVGTNVYTKTWQFCYQFVYMIFGVGLVEEFFYRGFLYRKLMDLKSSKWFAIICSSIIFGISHIFMGNVVQIFITFLMGIIFCVCRDKIKNCSTLSLIIIHGMHNALITLFVAIL